MFPKWLIDKINQLKVILVRIEQQDRTRPNGKHPTATSISYLISVIISSYTGRKISSIINKYCKDLNVNYFLSVQT